MDFLPFDLTKEEPMPVSEVIKLIPSNRGNNGHIRNALAMDAKWSFPVIGPDDFEPIRVEGCKLGDVLVTSREAIQRVKQLQTQLQQEADKVLHLVDLATEAFSPPKPRNPAE